VATTDRTTLAGPTRPLGTVEIPQFHLPSTSGKGTYVPRLYGAATIRFGDKKLKVDETRRVAFTLPLEQGVRSIDWDGARPVTAMPEDLLKDAPARAPYLPLPDAAMQVHTFARWAKNFDRWLRAPSASNCRLVRSRRDAPRSLRAAVVCQLNSWRLSGSSPEPR